MQLKEILVSVASCSLVFFAYSCKTRNFDALPKSISKRQLQQFLERSEWPAAADYIDAFGKIPTKEDEIPNSFHGASFSQVPKLIVALEKSFPNGNYSCVGRDVRLACEALDLFYQHYSGSNRIGFIRGSGITFDPYRSSMARLLEVHKKILLSSGFKADSFVLDPINSKPFVIIDATAWNAESNDDVNMSQARMFLKAAFDILRQKGLKPNSFLTKVGSLAIDPGSQKPKIGDRKRKFGRGDLTPEYNLQEFFDFIDLERNPEFDHPKETLRVTLQDLSYGFRFWHEKYSKIEVQENGSVVVVAGSPIFEYRAELFNRMIYLNEYILSEDFRNSLTAFAKAWNVQHVEKLVKNFHGSSYGVKN